MQKYQINKEEINYFQLSNQLQESPRLEELCGHYDYDRRRRVSKCIGSGRMEKGVDLVVGHRQKKKGLSWSSNGSKALSLLKIAELNGHWNHLCFPVELIDNSVLFIREYISAKQEQIEHFSYAYQLLLAKQGNHRGIAPICNNSYSVGAAPPCQPQTLAIAGILSA